MQQSPLKKKNNRAKKEKKDKQMLVDAPPRTRPEPILPPPFIPAPASVYKNHLTHVRQQSGAAMRFIKLMYLDISWPLSNGSVRICRSRVVPLRLQSPFILFLCYRAGYCPRNFPFFPLTTHCTRKQPRDFRAGEVIGCCWGAARTDFYSWRNEEEKTG